MKGFLSKFKEKIAGDNIEDGGAEEEYVELNADDTGDMSKVTVRPFSIEDFSDIKQILEALRDGKTIALINIKPLKEKDLIELKRAVNKLKNTCDAIDGDIAGFSDDYIVATPSFATIYRDSETQDLKDN